MPCVYVSPRCRRPRRPLTPPAYVLTLLQAGKLRGGASSATSSTRALAALEELDRSEAARRKEWLVQGATLGESAGGDECTRGDGDGSTRTREHFREIDPQRRVNSLGSMQVVVPEGEPPPSPSAAPWDGNEDEDEGEGEGEDEGPEVFSDEDEEGPDYVLPQAILAGRGQGGGHPPALMFGQEVGAGDCARSTESVEDEKAIEVLPPIRGVDVLHM